MNQSIHNPDCTKYFIAGQGYGTVDPGQYMDTGLDQIEVFTDEEAYLNRLYELSILDRYFISKTNNTYTYGLIDPSINLDTEGIEVFLDEDLYLTRLDELGINPEN